MKANYTFVERKLWFFFFSNESFGGLNRNILNEVAWTPNRHIIFTESMDSDTKIIHINENSLFLIRMVYINAMNELI